MLLNPNSFVPKINAPQEAVNCRLFVQRERERMGPILQVEEIKPRYYKKRLNPNFKGTYRLVPRLEFCEGDKSRDIPQ